MPSDVLRERAGKLWQSLLLCDDDPAFDPELHIAAELERVVRECAEEVDFHGHAGEARLGILGRFGLLESRENIPLDPR